MWSEARLLVAAVALLLGGVSPILLVVPASFEFTVTLLKLAWLVSGVASLYLAYRWYSAKQTLFGKKDGADTLAFFVMVVSGINLGLTGALGQNIGMSILSGRTVFFVVALLYLWTAYHLWKRWNSHGKKLF
ncbi:MAG: hypothetical protein Q8R25_00885 [bacterium]|nr:hypothetical protein [bacterium]